MKRRLIALALTVALIIGAAFAVNTYLNFVSDTIYQESTAHLGEIFHQANHALYTLVSDNWYRMEMWVPYLETAENEQAIREYIDKARAGSQFTDFYFLSRNAEYLALDGTRGYLDMGDKLPELILDKTPIAVNSVVPDKPEIMVFAVPCDKGCFDGFEYEAIAITYNNSDLVEALRISSFGGQASCFAVLPDGRVVLDNSGGNMENPHNIFSLLKTKGGLSPARIDELKQDFKEGRSGDLMFELNGRTQYMTYESASFQNWIVLGIVPADVVNANMNRLQSVTATVVACIASALGVLMLVLVVISNRQTLRKKDNALHARDELFATLSGNVDDIFMMLNPENLQVEYISPNVETLLGLPAEAVRRDIRVIGSADTESNSPYEIEHLAKMQPGEQLEWNREYRHQQTGEVRLFHVVAFVSDIQDEKKYIVDMSDRTKDRRLNQALQAAADAAENASRAKSDFLSRMSHDIRTPMNAIVGFSTLLARDAEKPEKVLEYTQKISASSNHLLGLITDVLDMSRIESGKTALNLAADRLTDIAAGLEAVIRPQTNAKNQSLIIRTEDIRHDAVFVDRVRLNQICLNLLSNAVKYTPAGGHIQLIMAERSCSGATANVEIVVEDDGYGMSQEYQKVIFDSFTREEDSRTSKIQGTGLGMAITKNLVDLMGGTIRVESQKGRGSRFTVALPLQIDQSAQTAAQMRSEKSEEAREEESALSGLRVLAAEDNELNAEILEAILEMRDAACDIRENGQLALDAFLQSSPGQYDLILMDVQMPVMNGYEATRAIRGSDHPAAKTIPIIAMTANAFAEDIQASLDAGMNAHISKPIDLEALEKTVRSVMQ